MSQNLSIEREFIPVSANNNEAWARLPLMRRYHPFLRALVNITAGSLMLQLPGGITLRYAAPKPGAKADITFHDWSCLDRLVTSGDLGWGEDYALGLWNT